MNQVRLLSSNVQVGTQIKAVQRVINLALFPGMSDDLVLKEAWLRKVTSIVRKRLLHLSGHAARLATEDLARLTFSCQGLRC